SESVWSIYLDTSRYRHIARSLRAALRVRFGVPSSRAVIKKHQPKILFAQPNFSVCSNRGSPRYCPHRANPMFPVPLIARFVHTSDHETCCFTRITATRLGLAQGCLSLLIIDAPG